MPVYRPSRLLAFSSGWAQGGQLLIRHFLFDDELLRGERDFDDFLEPLDVLCDFELDDFFEPLDLFDELLDFFDDDLRDGTLPPARRASEMPMATACFRLFTFLPERPLFSFPSPYSCITFETFFRAFDPYFAIAQNLRPQFVQMASRRLTDCGLRISDCLRSAVCGLRSAVCGLRSAVCGLYCGLSM